MQPQQLIAVARVTGTVFNKSDRYNVTIGGDGLADLKPPLSVWLHRPTYRGNDLKKILNSVNPHPRENGLFAAAELTWRKIGVNRKAQVNLKVGADFSDWGPEGVGDLRGWWLCVEREQLAASGEVYVFQLLGLAVHRMDEQGGREAEVVGTVTGYVETGAHGILETRTVASFEKLAGAGAESERPSEAEDGDAGEGQTGEVEVLVPLVPEYTELDLDQGRVYVRGYDDLIV